MKPNQQSRKDQVPTVTEKSSGLNYIRTSMNPTQRENDSRAKVTQNDKGGKRG